MEIARAATTGAMYGAFGTCACSPRRCSIASRVEPSEATAEQSGWRSRSARFSARPVLPEEVGGRQRTPHRLPASRQNCVSFSSVMRCPFSRSRLISISFSPPSRPAACCAFGRPRTTTVVRAEGPPCTIAPARLAARDGVAARLGQNAGEREVHALQRAQHAGLQRARAGCAARRSSRRRSRSASAARRCSGGRSPSDDRCTAARARRACGSASRASPLTSMPSSWPT